MERAATCVGVVVGAGQSRRFGGEISKQYADLGGRSVIARAVEGLVSRPGIVGVIVVVAPEDVEREPGNALRGLAGVSAVVRGGASRAQSVLSGVRAARDHEWVLVHDAARPLVPPAVVDAVLEATRIHGAAIPALVVQDTVKEVDAAGTVARTLDREAVRLAQTPQGSRVDWLLGALELAQRDDFAFSDEAGALQHAGRSVRVVAGDARNFKITTREDIDRARRALGGSATRLRVGTGYDVHRFGTEGTLVLGGVEFPGEPPLEGHSDADVVLHAVMDALLGAACLGDIGFHFPPSDLRYRGASSTGLATQVADLVRDSGFCVVNVDLTVLAERPKIGPRVPQMRAAIASCLRLETDRVAVKATTLEGLGALGRAEGIACQAVALLEADA